MRTDIPASVRTFVSRDGGLALLKTLVEQIDHAPRGGFIADGEGRAGGSWGVWRSSVVRERLASPELFFAVRASRHGHHSKIFSTRLLWYRKEG